MSGNTSINFQNILLTLKKYQDGTFELLYISSEIRNLLDRGEKFSYRMLHRNGHYISVEEEITRADDKSGLLLGIISDITALKENEKDLLEKKTVLDELTGVVPGMVYLMKATPDANHKFLYISEGCRNLTGPDPEAIINDKENFSRLVHVEDIDELFKRDQEAYLPIRQKRKYSGGQQKFYGKN